MTPEMSQQMGALSEFMNEALQATHLVLQNEMKYVLS